MQKKQRGAEGLPFSEQKSARGGLARRVLVLWGSMLLVASLLAAAVSLVAADVLALHRRQVTAEVTVTAETSPYGYGKQLAEAGVIRFPGLFALVTRAGGDFAPMAGSYTVDNTMDYRALRRAVVAPTRKNQEITVTVPPGTTVPGLIRIFCEAGVGTQETWEEAINHTDYDCPLLADLPTEGKLWRLEGYLFPDTYRVWQTSTPEAVVRRMLSNLERKFDSRYLARARELGMSVDQVLTVASLIEAESRYPDEYARISAVFHNRLNSRSYPYLESDATVQYALPARKEQLAHGDLSVDSPYNTYTHRGLPPGAICNPGADAILYAMFPAKTRDYFFVSGGERALFAETYAAHKRNIARVQAARASSEKDEKSAGREAENVPSCAVGGCPLPCCGGGVLCF